MSIIRAVAILKNANGFARDNAVNTFHVETTSAWTDNDLVSIESAVKDFYNLALASPLNAPLGRFLSNQFSTVQVKQYVENPVLADGQPVPAGAPIRTSTESNLPGRIAAQDLPEEVAVCVSYSANAVPNVPAGRLRGRLYFGPLNTAALTGLNGAVMVPNSDLLLSLRTAYARFSTRMDTEVGDAVIYSRPYAGRAAIVRPGRTTLPAIAARNGSTHGIDSVWTDNAWDTQRRRGMRATAKTLITA